MSPTGRAVRLVNVITLPDHRGRGYATELISDVIDWARRIAADRIDLSGTPDGQRIYQRLGFEPTSAPRTKLVL
jgi:GNAT superfamily N-acetyltransferase